jgi:hypothetical protein
LELLIGFWKDERHDAQGQPMSVLTIQLKRENLSRKYTFEERVFVPEARFREINEGEI